MSLCVVLGELAKGSRSGGLYGMDVTYGRLQRQILQSWKIPLAEDFKQGAVPNRRHSNGTRVSLRYAKIHVMV